ncbi:MAG: hypothetical protein WBB74_00910, partial [Gaiellaceae bacterium]
MERAAVTPSEAASGKERGDLGVSAARQAGLPAPAGPIPGYLLIADRGNNRILLVDGRKRILWRYPKPGVAPAFPFRFDDDAFFGPGLRTIISNQEEEHTIQVLSFPGGHVLWHYGHVNVRGSARGYLNTPDDAYLLANGLRTVADAYNCRVLFISAAKRIVLQIGRTGGCAHDPPRSLGAVNGGTPLPNGGILVSEIRGSWLDAFSRTGRLLWSVRAPVSYPSDPQWLGGGHILLSDYARPGHVLIMTTRGRLLWRYGPSSGPGMLDHPSLALRLRSGLIAVNDDYRHRVVLISIRRRRIVWQYGHTDAKGTRPGFLNTPDGMDLLPYERARRISAIR